jgi:hypothetical protein
MMELDSLGGVSKAEDPSTLLKISRWGHPVPVPGPGGAEKLQCFLERDAKVGL